MLQSFQENILPSAKGFDFLLFNFILKTAGILGTLNKHRLHSPDKPSASINRALMVDIFFADD